MNTNEVVNSKESEKGSSSLRVEQKVENSATQKAETAQEQHKKRILDITFIHNYY